MTATENASSSINREFGPEFYDRMHSEVSYSISHKRYDRLFGTIAANVRQHGSHAILEVGCGSGFLAKVILEQYGGAYRGFDFSPTAIVNAGARTGRPELFHVGNALDKRCYFGDYDTILCTEMLEHVEADIDVIRLWRNGAWCVCSVPNFDYPGHVRHFTRSEDVVARYGELIDIVAVVEIARPILRAQGFVSYLRELGCNWNNPHTLLGLCGIQTFHRLGGWFLFTGTKRSA